MLHGRRRLATPICYTLSEGVFAELPCQALPTGWILKACVRLFGIFVGLRLKRCNLSHKAKLRNPKSLLRGYWQPIVTSTTG